MQAVHRAWSSAKVASALESWLRMWPDAAWLPTFQHPPAQVQKDHVNRVAMLQVMQVYMCLQRSHMALSVSGRARRSDRCSSSSRRLLGIAGRG